MPQGELDILSMLRVLTLHETEFIVVGGVSAALNGAPIATYDLDLVHSRTPGNINKLLAALEELDAHTNRSGALDLLGTIAKGRGYDELLPHTTQMEVAPGLRVRVLDLATLIEIKEEIGQDKDKAVLPILRATLRERSRPAR